jgi:hypothetical protein
MKRSTDRTDNSDQEPRLPHPAGSQSQQQQEDLVTDPYDVDPENVVQPGVTTTKTPVERDDASGHNPPLDRRR